MSDSVKDAIVNMPTIYNSKTKHTFWNLFPVGTHHGNLLGLLEDATVNTPTIYQCIITPTVWYLFPVGTHHGNLPESLVTMSRLTYFIPRAHRRAQK